MGVDRTFADIETALFAKRSVARDYHASRHETWHTVLYDLFRIRKSSHEAVANEGKLWPKGFRRRSYVCIMVK